MVGTITAEEAQERLARGENVGINIADSLRKMAAMADEGRVPPPQCLRLLADLTEANGNRHVTLEDAPAAFTAWAEASLEKRVNG